jgi:hypothetical protein
MNNQISKNEVDEAFDILCEQYDYSTEKEVYNDFLFLMKNHQILFYELLHNPKIETVTTIEEANELSDLFTKKQQKLIDFINEKKSCDELKALFFKLKDYIEEFYNLLSAKDKLELKANLKNLGKEIFQKLEYLKFLEFEYISEEITEKHQKLLKSMNKDCSFVNCNLNTKKFEIKFSKSKNKKRKDKRR